MPVTARDVVSFYSQLEREGVRIWVDGGWCVDALVGRQVREHDDLDFAVGRPDAERLVQLLRAWGFEPAPRDTDSPWCFVMQRDGFFVDAHVFEFDEVGNNTYGIKYPYGSLTGTGVLDGTSVRCIAPEWSFRFKTSYAPRDKDLLDVEALSEHFAFPIPETHRRSR